MLAACYLFLQGTPFLYQGQEIGMTNIRLDRIDQYIDVSSKNNFHKFHLKDSYEKRMARIHASSRDSSRTPMQWNDTEHAGFTTGTPWFYVNPNYKEINVAAEEKDPDSILNFYRACLRLRKTDETVLWGSYREYQKGSGTLYLYERRWKGEVLLILCSFSEKPIFVRLPKAFRNLKGELILCNYRESRAENLNFAPFEARVYRYYLTAPAKNG